MEHHREQAQTWSSYLTEASFSQQASSQPGSEEVLLCSEPNGGQLDHAGASREVPGGRKRRGPKPTQTPEEKRMKKIEADRNYRKNQKDEVNELRAMKSRVERAENRFGVIEEMESKLHMFERIKSMLGGIDESEMVTEINRLKNIEFQYSKYQQVESSLNHQNAQPFFDFLQEQDCHGMLSVNFKKQEQGSEIDWVTLEIRS